MDNALFALGQLPVVNALQFLRRRINPEATGPDASLLPERADSFCSSRGGFERFTLVRPTACLL